MPNPDSLQRIADLEVTVASMAAFSDLVTANLNALTDTVAGLSAHLADVQAKDAGPNAKRLATMLVELEALNLIDADVATRIRDAHKGPAPAPPPAPPPTTPAGPEPTTPRPRPGAPTPTDAPDADH